MEYTGATRERCDIVQLFIRRFMAVTLKLLVWQGNSIPILQIKLTAFLDLVIIPGGLGGARGGWGSSIEAVGLSKDGLVKNLL